MSSDTKKKDEMGPTKEHRNTTASLFIKRDLQGFGNLFFPRIGQSSEEENKSLSIARWITFTQSFDNSTRRWRIEKGKKEE